MNEEALAHKGLSRQKQTNKQKLIYQTYVCEFRKICGEETGWSLW